MSERQYTDQQVKNLEKVIKAKFQGVGAEFRSVREAVGKLEYTNQKALDEVKSSNSAKFDSVNEFRGQLKDQAGTFVTRKELFGWLGAAIATAISVIKLLQ